MSKATREKNTAPTSLEVHLLGPFQVTVDGRAVEERQWQRPRPKLLVKLLALQPHHQLHREQVMEMLWPEQEPESASNNLHKAIHMARRALEPGLRSAAASHFILTQGQQIVLCAPEKLSVDVEAFEQAAIAAAKERTVEAYEAALSFYRGDLLPEDLYEDWTAGRRERLRSSYQELLVSLARAYEARGQYQQSVERFKELVASDPANEEAHRHLMRLYAATHQRRQALRQFEECCDAVRRELDAEPERATVELHEQIKAGRIQSSLRAEDEKGRARTQSASISSLAILPLQSADAATEYLSDGITESIINTLSQLPQLKVTARSTVFRYKGVAVDLREIGDRLGVRAVLTGRVLHREGTLNIQVELVDARDGSQLWGEQYNRNSSAIFEVQEEISKEIAEKLRLKLSGAERGQLTKRYTEDVEAYRLYLMGRYHWNKRTVERFEKGMECFKQAIKLDPAYALAYAGISDCYAFKGDVGLAAVPSREAFSKAKEAARQALEIDDTLAEAHASLAHANMHFFEWPESERAFERAIELSPNLAIAHEWYAFYLLFNGRGDEALLEAERALELDPLSLPANGDVGQILHYMRRYDEAIEQYHKTLELEPNRDRAHLWLGWTYEQKGMYEEAINEFQRAKALLPDSMDSLAALGCTFAYSGRTDEARAVLAELSEISTHRYVSPYNMAIVYLSLGEKEKAFEWLGRAYEECAEWMIYLSVDPRFDSLRAEPRFKDLLRRIGFKQ